MKEKMMPKNGGQGKVDAPYSKTSEAKGRLATGKDLRQRPSGGNKAKRV